MRKIYCESPCGTKNNGEHFEFNGFIYYPCCLHCHLKENCHEECPYFRKLQKFEKIAAMCKVYRLIVEEKNGEKIVLEVKKGERFYEI